jgi:putative endonuclease
VSGRTRADSAPNGERRRHERRGRRAERIAALYLRLRGYRILERRFKVPSGEIDLVARKGKRLAFVEVKMRADLEACEASITPKLRARVRRAAEIWLSRNAAYQEFDLGFDVIFMRPRKWPVYLKDSI